MTDAGQASPHHIIVVDDEPAAREMVAEYLELHGYRVTRCDGGSDLRAAIRVDKPDLVICDDAVDWSVQFQQAVLSSPVATMPHGRISFRLGVAIGDIVVSQGDRFGEGVALAVRMQEVARPGTVTLSDYSHQFVANKVSTQFTDLGSRSLKNISAPMLLWEWSSEPEVEPSPSA